MQAAVFYDFAAGQLSQRQINLLDTVNRNLNDIASPLSRRFIIDGNHLTPVEAQVTNLSNKQINFTSYLRSHL